MQDEGTYFDLQQYLTETSLREALQSRLFLSLRDNGHLLEDHAGGCVLYEKRELVRQLAES